MIWRQIMNELSLLNSLFNDIMDNSNSYGVYSNYANPKVDVKENENSYILEMELPGKTEKDVDIELNHGNLTISSKDEEVKDEKKDTKNEKYILKERKISKFERRFALPKDVDSEKISANFKNGILTVNMMKKPETSSKKIAIEAC